MAGGWKASLAAVLKEHNGRKSGGSVSAYATQAKRAETLYSAFSELRELGFKLENVREFRGRHMKTLGQLWESKGQAPSTIQNKISTLRVFSEWIGKSGMIESTEHYVSNPEAARRSSINKTDKSWSQQGVDRAALIAQVAARDPRIAIQLELQHGFGLRPRESWQLRPHLADKGSYLQIIHGTKGGRDRVVAIDTPEKRALIDRAKTFAATRSSSMGDPRKTLAQVKNHYYDVVRDCGIKRKGGLMITSHGLRHEKVNDDYERKTGVASPVRGGAPVDREIDRAARLEIAEELGHSRESITTHYLGR
jgi:site-specific recombinase XerC